MAAGYNTQGQYVDHQGNPAPDPRTGDMAPAMSQAISNLFGTSYTPGRAWDPSMGPEEEFNPNVPHDPTALATGRSGGGTFMPVQIGTTGAAKPALGIQTDPNVFPDPEERANITGGMNLTGESSKTADTGDIEKNKMLQRHLNSMGAQLAVDGIIGPKTQAAMEQAHLGAQGTSDTPSAVGTSPGSALPPQITHNMGPMSSTPVRTTATQPPPPAAAAAPAATTSESPAATAHPIGLRAVTTDTSGKAGFEKVLNMIGGGADWVRDLLWSKGAGGAAIGLEEFFNRPTPDTIALLDRMEKKRQADIEGSKGEFGTYMYDRGWGNTLDDILGAVTTDEPSSVTVDVPPPTTGHDVTASTKGSRGAEIAATRRAKKAQLGTDPGADEAVETQVPTTLGEVVDIPPPPVAAAAQPQPAVSLAPGTQMMGHAERSRELQWLIDDLIDTFGRGEAFTESDMRKFGP